MSMSPLRNTNEAADQRALEAESGAASWSDDELLDNIADIINENFILEVEASQRLRR